MRHACLTLMSLSALALTGCATFPELDAAISETAKETPAPNLLDNRTLLAAAGTTLNGESEDTLAARAEALRARTTDLDQPVIAPDETLRITTTAERLAEESARVAPEG